MNEQSIILGLKAKFPIKGGIGDDAACFGKYVITKDLLVEDIHFRCSYVDAESLGIKALEVNLSDIAAMGANPKYVLLGLSIPKNLNTQYVEEFFDSFAKVCKERNVELIGGDTTGSPDKLFISVTAIGETENPKMRCSAKPGDLVAVCGELGHAHIGLVALENKISGYEGFKNKLLRPKALLEEGNKLGKNPKVTSMMDISDGLLVDLKKLCSESKVSAELDISSLSNSEEFYTACKKLKLDPISVMLSGGEDYGLLTTIKPDALEDFVNDEQMNIKIIGKIIAGVPGEVTFNKDIDLSIPEYDHFSS